MQCFSVYRKGTIKMGDIYFKNYKKKDDTGEIPITRSEKEFQDKLNQQKYDEIIKRQEQFGTFEDYQNGEVPPSHYSNQPDKKEKPKKKKKKKKGCGCGCGTLLLIFLLIIAIIPVGSFGYVYSLCSKTNYVKSDVGSSALSNDDYYNVLLIGCDKSDGTSQRSDSMILVTIDKVHQKIKFTSFMRDLWVSIPGYDDDRLNAAYSYGGAELLMKTINQNFAIEIDNYVMVDFEMFEKLIDGLGGVTVDITEDEADFINETSHAKVKSGTNTLNGDYALIYCRIRYLDSDFNRTQRQRKVMNSIMKQLVSQNPIKTLSVMSDILPLITTNISHLDLTVKAFGALGYLKYGNDQFRLPIDDGYSNEIIYGQDVLVPYLDENKDALHSFIYES